MLIDECLAIELIKPLKNLSIKANLRNARNYRQLWF